MFHSSQRVRLLTNTINTEVCLNNIGVEGATAISEALRVNSTVTNLYLH